MFRSNRSKRRKSDRSSQQQRLQALLRPRSLVERLEDRLLLSFSEDFSAGASNFTVVDGTWGVSGGAYQITASNPIANTHLNNKSVHNTTVSGDFVLTADASVVDTSSDWNDFAVIFGYQDANNYYYFSSNESNDGATSGILKVAGGTVTELADITTPIASNTTYQVKVERVGNTINVYRNNTLLATANDSTYTSGKVGFGTSRDNASFDNVVVTTPPAAPSGLSASAVSSSQINLSWTDNANDETGFAIDRATNSTFTTGLVTSTVGANATSYNATGLSANTTYYFRVRATNAAGASANSSTANATTQSAALISEDFSSGASNFTVVDGTWGVVSGTYQITTSNPIANTHLNNKSVHNTTISGDFTLTVDASVVGDAGTAWNDFAVIFGYQDASNYYFFSSNESNDGNTSGILKVVGGNVTELADITSTITSDTTYSLKVERIGNTINVYRNNTLLATANDSTYTSGKVGFGTSRDRAIFDNLVVTGTALTAPAAPSGLGATAVSSSQINLSWTDNSGNETGFEIDRATNSTFTTGLVTDTVGANTTTYQATGLSASTTYYFRVRATNSAGDSANSNTANATTQAAVTVPAAPSGLSATAASSSQINLSWTDNANNETGFEIDRATNSTFTSGLVTDTVGANVTTYSATGLSASTTYYFRVRATNSAGDSSNSNTASASTQAPGVTIRYVGADPDNNGNGTIGNPYGTINAAYQASNQGDEIHILTGNYPSQTVNGKTSANSWTTNVIIKPAPGATVSIAGGEFHSRRVTVIGIDFTGWFAARGGAEYFRLEDSVVRGGMKVQSNHSAVINNQFLDGANVDALQIQGQTNQVPGTDLLIEGNFIKGYHVTQSGPHVDAIQILNFSNVIIRNNRISHDGNSNAIILTGSVGPISNILIENNFMVHGAAGYGNGGTLMNISDANASNITVVNNTLMGTVIVGAGSNKVIRNNIIQKLAKTNANISDSIHDHNYLLQAVQGMATHATEVIGAEPKFVSKSNLDLHLVLVNGSPVDVNNNAIDLSFGTSTGAPLLDFDGDTRDLNDLWVGADEE